MKPQSESKAAEEQLPGKVAPEKQIPAALLPRKRQNLLFFKVTIHHLKIGQLVDVISMMEN